jgi:hypothetical protein
MTGRTPSCSARLLRLSRCKIRMTLAQIQAPTKVRMGSLVLLALRRSSHGHETSASPASSPRRENHGRDSCPLGSGLVAVPAAVTGPHQQSFRCGTRQWSCGVLRAPQTRSL